MGREKVKCRHIYEYVNAIICPYCNQPTCEPDWDLQNKLNRDTLRRTERVMADGGASKKRHSLKYIHQLIDWGFSMEFIARDCGITVESLEMRLYRERRRSDKIGQNKS